MADVGIELGPWTFAALPLPCGKVYLSVEGIWWAGLERCRVAAYEFSPAFQSQFRFISKSNVASATLFCGIQNRGPVE